MAIKRHKTAGLDYTLPESKCIHCGGMADIPEPVPISSQLGSRCLPSGSSRFWCWGCWDERKARDWRERELQGHLVKETDRLNEVGSEKYRKEAVARFKRSRLGSNGGSRS